MNQLYDAGDEKQVKATRRKHKLAENQRAADLKAVMSSESGRRHMWHLLEICGVFTDTLHTDPFMLGRFLGRRSLGLNLLEEVLSSCHQEYLLMETEARTKQKEDEANA